MIACPGCQSQLPDWSKSCQFCGADVTKIVRPKVAQRVVRTTAPSWVWVAYNVVSVLIMIEGVGGVLTTIRNSQLKVLGETVGFGMFSFISLAIDGLTVLFGLGLLLQVRLIRDIANYVCGMRIIFGVASLVGAVAGTMFSGIFGVLITILVLFNIASAAFMIYLIGETDKIAPVI